LLLETGRAAEAVTVARTQEGPMIDPGSATTGLPVKELTGALEKLGIFDKIKEKLFQQPDRAAAKLQSVFAELSRVLNVVDTELTTFGAVTFDKKRALKTSIGKSEGFTGSPVPRF
jgi:hypothetical protein